MRSGSWKPVNDYRRPDAINSPKYDQRRHHQTHTNVPVMNFLRTPSFRRKKYEPNLFQRRSMSPTTPTQRIPSPIIEITQRRTTADQHRTRDMQELFYRGNAISSPNRCVCHQQKIVCDKKKIGWVRRSKHRGVKLHDGCFDSHIHNMQHVSFEISWWQQRGWVWNFGLHLKNDCIHC